MVYDTPILERIVIVFATGLGTDPLTNKNYVAIGGHLPSFRSGSLKGLGPVDDETAHQRKYKDQPEDRKTGPRVPPPAALPDLSENDARPGLRLAGAGGEA